MSLKCLPISSLHFMRLRRNRPRYSSKIYFLFILPFLLPVKHMGTSKFMRLFSFMQIDGIKSLISLISLSSHQKMKSVTRSFVEPLAKHLYLECSSNGSVYSLYISCNNFSICKVNLLRRSYSFFPNFCRFLLQSWSGMDLSWRTALQSFE